MSERAGSPEDRPADEDMLQRFQAFRRFLVVCADCQSEMPADYHYCADCGARLATECPACRHPLPPFGARFCPNCGLLIPRIAPAEDSAGAADKPG